MPSDSDSARMEALTRANIGLLRRVADLERRVEFLERRAGDRAPAPLPVEPVQPEVEPDSSAPVTLEPAAREPMQPDPLGVPIAASTQPREMETRIGLTWLNRVAVLTCILAVAFFFKYAVENEWIGPGGRVALGVIGGLACLGLADTLWRRGHQVYAHGLCGLGIAILYLSIQASFSFYRLLPQPPAFVLMVLITAAAGAMAMRYASLAIAMLGLLGGYATPVLLSTGEKNIWFLFSYVLLLNLGAMALARRNTWPMLEVLALSGTAVLYGGGIESTVSAEERLPAGLFAVLYWMLFLSGTNWAVVYLAHFLACVAAMVVWEKSLAGFAPAMFGFTAGLLALCELRKGLAAPSVAFTSFWICYGIWRAFFIGDPGLEGEAGLLTAVFGLFLAWTPLRMALRGTRTTERDLVLIALNAIFFTSRIYTLFERDYAGWRGLLAVALAAVYLALARFLWTKPTGQRDQPAVQLLVGIALVLLTLAIPIQLSSYRITMAWAAEVASLAWIASRTQSKPLALGALLVLAIALVRLISVDAEMYLTGEYSLLANARFLTFLVSGIAFILSGRWLLPAWPSLPVVAATPYVAGHFALLLGLGLEVEAWASRTAAPENVRNLASAGISIVFALYAVALAAAGIATRTRINRVLGLGLIGFVVAKLYLYDVWELRLLYRFLAFAALGGLLLVMSFLYSRYRRSIESWLHDEERPFPEPPGNPRG